MEAVELFENEGGSINYAESGELEATQENAPDEEELADKERARTDTTGATPTELAGAGGRDDVPSPDEAA